MSYGTGSQLYIQSCRRALSTLVQMGDRKGQSLSMSLNLWVGWPLQHKIIDGPACQGVLILDEVCQVGMWVLCPTTTYTKSDTCAF